MQRIITYEQMIALNDLDRGRTDGGVGCTFDSEYYLCRDVSGLEAYPEYQAIMLASRPYIPPITVIAFMRRFTAEERIRIRNSDNPILCDFIWLLEQAPEVRLDDPTTTAGVEYAESIGAIAEGRGAEILAP